MITSHKSRVRHIFAYGTLMSSEKGSMGAAERALLNAFAVRIGPATTRGRMYHAGACPGVVLGGSAKDVVHGELWQLPSELPDLLAALDRYEGCAHESPLPHPYTRLRIRLPVSGGQRVTAWIYAWAKSTEGLVRIEDGCWRGPLRVPTTIEMPEREAAA